MTVAICQACRQPLPGPDAAPPVAMTFGDLMLFAQGQYLERDGKSVRITRSQTELLAVFFQNGGRATKAELHARCSGKSEKLVEVHVHNLRLRLEVIGFTITGERNGVRLLHYKLTPLG